jgi:hypothetical protein
MADAALLACDWGSARAWLNETGRPAVLAA